MGKNKWKRKYKKLEKVYKENFVREIGYSRLDLPTQPLQEGVTPHIQRLVPSDIVYRGITYTKSDIQWGHKVTPDDPLAHNLKVVNNG
jgi:hypothetical protein